MQSGVLLILRKLRQGNTKGDQDGKIYNKAIDRAIDEIKDYFEGLSN